MKKIFVLFFSLVSVLSSCDKEDIGKIYRDNEKKVTIQTGVWGTISFREGNCMPGNKNKCSEKPVFRQVRIYPKTRIADVVSYNQDEPTFFMGFNATLIKALDTDNQGFFQIELPAGEYSLVTVENGKLYANSFQGVGTEAIINPITIESGKTSKHNFVIYYKAAY